MKQGEVKMGAVSELVQLQQQEDRYGHLSRLELYKILDAGLPGISFHAETALTQARMAMKRYDTAFEYDNSVDRDMSVHLSSVIEQLEEIVGKLKKAAS